MSVAGVEEENTAISRVDLKAWHVLCVAARNRCE